MAETAIEGRTELRPPALVQGEQDDGTLNKTLNAFIWEPPRRGWLALLRLGLAGTGLLSAAVAVTLAKGIGTWGNNIPVGWAFGIINFVWWIGIGHAGTLISAILLLFQQKWRTSINRFAEAMKLFAGMQGGPFPVVPNRRSRVALLWAFPLPGPHPV